MIRLSTGLRSAMLWDSGLRDLMWLGTIFIYTGDQPATADMPPTGTLIGQITEDGGVFTFGQSTNGLRTEARSVTSIKHAGNWVVKGKGTGAPGWWRFVWNLGPSAGFSTFAPRIDGLVGDAFSNLPSVLSPSTTLPNTEFAFHFLQL